MDEALSVFILNKYFFNQFPTVVTQTVILRPFVSAWFGNNGPNSYGAIEIKMKERRQKLIMSDNDLSNKNKIANDIATNNTTIYKKC